MLALCYSFFPKYSKFKIEVKTIKLKNSGRSKFKNNGETLKQLLTVRATDVIKYLKRTPKYPLKTTS